jgi:hypothetical protein
VTEKLPEMQSPEPPKGLSGRKHWEITLFNIEESADGFKTIEAHNKYLVDELQAQG